MIFCYHSLWNVKILYQDITLFSIYDQISGIRYDNHTANDFYLLAGGYQSVYFTARAMLARYMLSSCVRLSVHLSVRPSVCHKSEFYKDAAKPRIS